MSISLTEYNNRQAAIPNVRFATTQAAKRNLREYAEQRLAEFTVQATAALATEDRAGQIEVINSLTTLRRTAAEFQLSNILADCTRLINQLQESGKRGVL